MGMIENISFISSNSFLLQYKKNVKNKYSIIIDSDGVLMFVSTCLYEVLHKVVKDIFKLQGYATLKEMFIWKHTLSIYLLDKIFDSYSNFSISYNLILSNYEIIENNGSLKMVGNNHVPALLVKYTSDIQLSINEDIITNGYDYTTLRLFIDHGNKMYISYLYFKELNNFIYPIDLSTLFDSKVVIPYLSYKLH